MSTSYGTAIDGTPLVWDILMPPGKTVAPWILTVESSHWVEDNGIPGDATQALLNAGFAAVHPWHRLAPPNKIAGQIGNGQYPQQTDDITMAIAAAKLNPACDGRVGIAGGSGGANIAMFFQAKGLVYAGVAFSPATYLPDIVALGGKPAQKALNYAPAAQDQIDASPNTYLQTGVSSPLMLVAFVADQMPANQFTDGDNKLNELGIDHQSILLPGQGHSWKARNSVDWVGFLQSHLPPL